MAYTPITPSAVHVVPEEPDHLLIEPQFSQGIGHSCDVYGAVVPKKNVTPPRSGCELDQRDYCTGGADPTVVAALQKCTHV